MSEAVDLFITRWQAAGGSERANYQIFLTELAALLDLPRPDPAADDTRDNAYVFERRVQFRHGDGSDSSGYIDLYRRGCFVLEAKKIKLNAVKGFDEALLRARSQAEGYARALPADEGRPPFLIVVDVGNVIRLYSDFTRSGATYTPFPDPRSYEIRLDHLRDEGLRQRLKQVWLDPMALDPSRQSAKVTREIAERLAEIALDLEEAGHSAEQVAGFLSRCLFTFFAEDVELIPKRSFATLLDSLSADPSLFVPMVQELWKVMDQGGVSVALKSTLPKFNGKLFKEPEVLPLKRKQIDLLRRASKADWQHVEPAIFGTLLERALDPRERHALGAHYTPRAYVERLVLPTVIEPLREDWRDVQAAALTLAAEGKDKEARMEIRGFLKKLCEVRVLDPACGSGNFLYVTLEHLKRLEGEVLLQLEALGVSMSLDAEGLAVDPHQFLGLEINPRAAAIAELVLWIGYLQWHFRTRGHVLPSQPVLRNFRNIECRDAVLAYDRVERLLDDRGQPVTRWDGITTREHPVTGEQVPDDTARVQVERYVNPRPADWPQADFVVGNPPFIGASTMRRALGDGYVDALRSSVPAVPESADFVMYWWHHAAGLTREGRLRRFGLITTNSLRQTFNRRVVELHLSDKKPLSIVYAIPDHPWVDSAGGAAVRIAMTVGAAGSTVGRLALVSAESDGEDDEVAVALDERHGTIYADLRTGANVTGVLALRSNSSISNTGVKLHGAGFIVNAEEAAGLGLGSGAGVDAFIRPYRNGRDLTDKPRNVMVIDLDGLTAEDVRGRFPKVFQWVLERVKPERDHNNEAYRRSHWWLFGRKNTELRAALHGLRRYIATVETSKHRTFQFLDGAIRPDNKLIAIASDDAAPLGVLSSRPHVTWALATGGRLGVGNDPVYVKSKCFEPFPFPVSTDAQQSRIRDLAEQLDAHRKRQQAAHPTLTLTGMYNVLEKLKSGEALTEKEKVIHEQGLVSVLKQLHDELDLAVLEAYGWSDLAPLMQVVNGNAEWADESANLARLKPRPTYVQGGSPTYVQGGSPTYVQGGSPTYVQGGRPTYTEAIQQLDEALLERLVALNAERAAEEARGLIRWLRPEFQNPSGATAPTQVGLDAGADEEDGATVKPAAAKKLPWPKDLTDQVRAVTGVLNASPLALSEADIAAQFSGKGTWRKRLPQLLDMLTALGRARELDGKYVSGT